MIDDDHEVVHPQLVELLAMVRRQPPRDLTRPVPELRCLAAPRPGPAPHPEGQVGPAGRPTGRSHDREIAGVGDAEEQAEKLQQVQQISVAEVMSIPLA